MADNNDEDIEETLSFDEENSDDNDTHDDNSILKEPDTEESIQEAAHDTIKPLLDSTTYGAVKEGENIKAWELQGLTKPGSDKTFSGLHLANNPPKLVFKKFNSPYTEEYAIYLDKFTAQQLYDATGNVVRAYKSMPIKDKKDKKDKWKMKNIQRRMRESFEDNPASFIIKGLGIIAVIVLIVMALL
jgi:hypothetical protein